MKLAHVALAASLLAAGLGQAAIITDGTMSPSGKPTTLPGSPYTVSDDLGLRKGDNLFHSFSTFNLLRGESATFTGPEGIQNIISRVTGGDSYIDGRISSEIAGANLYLVNPNGITFGANATLDVSGSFYATTADYLELGPVRFDATATVPANFHLAVGPPTAFGFLDANPAAIVVTDSRLSVTGKLATLTFVGGDITITRDKRTEGDLLSAVDGIALVSVGSAGEATVSGAGMDTSTFSKMGKATVSSKVANPGGEEIATTTGNIFIAAGSFIVDRAHVASKATGFVDSGNLSVSASEVKVINRGKIQSSSAEGKAGDISITAGSLIVDGANTEIASDATGAGNSGNLSVSASEVQLGKGGKIQTSSGTGKAGDIGITAAGSIILLENQSAIQTENTGSITLKAHTVTSSGAIKVNRDGSSKGGDLRITSQELNVLGLGSTISDTNGSIRIDTDHLTMSKGYIAALTSKTGSGSRGDLLINVKKSADLTDESNIGTSGRDAGSIVIDAANATVTLDHSYIYMGNWVGDNTAPISLSARDITIKNEGRISSISGETIAGDISITATGVLTLSGNGLIRSNSRGSQDAGNINVSASSILLEDGGKIQTLVGDPDKPGKEVTGNGGSISIHAAESVTISGPGSGMDVSTESKGNAGTLTITSPLLQLADGGQISSASRFTGVDAGDAGLIDLRIGKVLSLDSSSIKTDADHANGGNIKIDPVLAYLRNGYITTSVHGGEGDGGNISLAADAVVLEGGHISADADKGHGGSVGITAALFLADQESTVTASSERGVPGTVDISAPLVDVSGNLVMLPERMLEEDDLAPRTCAVSDDSSSFIVGASPLQRRPEQNLLAF